MDGLTSEQIIIALNTGLVGVVAILLKQLVVRFERMELAINKLNERLAVVVNEQSHHNEKLHSQSVFEERIDREVKDIRNRIHDIGNNINGLQLRHDLREE